MKAKIILTIVVLLAVAIHVPFPHADPVCADYGITDYCYRAKVTVTNSSGSAINAGDPIAWQDGSQNAIIYAGQLHDQEYIDGMVTNSHGWDAFVFNYDLSEVELTAQDMDLNPARWWVRAPSVIPNGDTATMWLYMGSNENKRNQGFFLDSTDKITVTDHADFDLTDHLEIIVTVETYVPAQTGAFLNKWTANTGYFFGVVNAGGTSRFVGLVDTSTLYADLVPTWDGSEVKLRMTYDDPVLNIDYWNTTTEAWVNLATDGAANTLTANAQDIEIGPFLQGIMREVEIRDNFAQATYAPVARWGMHAINISEASEANPTYTGTVENELNAGTHDGAYSLTRDMTGISVAIGPMALVAAGSAVSTTTTLADVVGAPMTTDPFTEGTTYQAIPFYSMLTGAQSAIGMTDDAFWILITVLVSATGMIGLWFAGVRQIEYLMIVPVIGFTTGAVIGLYAGLVAVVAGLSALGMGLLARRSSE